MAEVRFYHLTERPLEAVLPVMLERSLARGWRAVVRGTDPARIEALSEALWNWGDESFLAHGTPADGMASLQPVWLCCEPGNPNRANALFLIDGAEAAMDELAAMQLSAVLFDGLDEVAVARARAQWRKVGDAGLKAVYWAQDQGGAWVRRDEAG